MIREAKQEDINLLSNFMKELVKHVQTSSKDIYTCNLKHNFSSSFEDWFSNSLEKNNSKLFIAENNQKSIGFIMGRISEPYINSSLIDKIGLIEVLWINQNFRNQGYGKELVNNFELWIKSKGIQYIDVSYLIGNVEAEQTWKALGYVPYRIHSRKEILN